MQSFIKKFLIVSALIFPAFALAAPGIPNQFYGTVSFADGATAPDGTMVQAKINGEIVAECPVKNGNGEYGYNPILCFVTDPNGDRGLQEPEMSFFVNGLDTGETKTFEKGASKRLNFALPNVQSDRITKGADDVISTTTVAVIPGNPTIIKMGDSLNIELSSPNSTNAVISEVKKLLTYTGGMAVMSGQTVLNGYEINIIGEDINIEVTMKYDDTGIDESTIAPYKFVNDVWRLIDSPVPVIDTVANTITFSIPSAHTPYIVLGSPPALVTTSGGGGGSNNAPSISDVNVEVGRTGAIITWKTNETSISWIAYGVSTDYGKEMKTATYITDHSITVSDLSPSTTYHFQVKSKDSAGNVGSYTDKTFTTLITQIKGDINDNGKVDKYDFALMMSEWGKSGLNIPSDLNKNGKVDKYDFALLMVNWTK